MNWEVIETWRDYDRRSLKFRIKDKTDGTEEVCGVTDEATNKYSETADTVNTPEQAKEVFEKNQELIVRKAVALIEKGEANDQGHYVLTSKNIMQA